MMKFKVDVDTDSRRFIKINLYYKPNWDIGWGWYAKLEEIFYKDIVINDAFFENIRVKAMEKIKEYLEETNSRALKNQTIEDIEKQLSVGFKSINKALKNYKNDTTATKN